MTSKRRAEQVAGVLDGLVSPTVADVSAAMGEFDAEDIAAVAAHKALAGGGGSSTFNGARYPIQEDGSNIQISDSGSLFRNNLGGGIGANPSYDVGGYATPDEDNYITNGYLIAPADGYYRITGCIRGNFGGSDTTTVDCVIVSPDRDSEWDDADHVNIGVSGGRGSGCITVTHWLAAGDRVGFEATCVDGSTFPFASGALEMVFVGTGTNPAL